MSTNLLAQVLAESMERGHAEEARVLRRRYLAKRFRAIPPALDERIVVSDANTLTALFDRALSATAVADR